MLVEASADVNARLPEQVTALMLVVQNGLKKPAAEWDVKARAVAEVLLKAGADAGVTIEVGQDALYMAKYFELPQTVPSRLQSQSRQQRSRTSRRR